MPVIVGARDAESNGQATWRSSPRSVRFPRSSARSRGRRPRLPAAPGRRAARATVIVPTMSASTAHALAFRRQRGRPRRHSPAGPGRQWQSRHHGTDDPFDRALREARQCAARRGLRRDVRPTRRRGARSVQRPVVFHVRVQRRRAPGSCSRRSRPLARITMRCSPCTRIGSTAGRSGMAASARSPRGTADAAEGRRS